MDKDKCRYIKSDRDGVASEFYQCPNPPAPDDSYCARHRPVIDLMRAQKAKEESEDEE